MKTKIRAGLIMVLAAGLISIRADDNPSQAAARMALAKKLFELNQPKTQLPPRWDSGVMVIGPDKSTNQLVEPVTAKPEPAQLPLATTNLILVPAKETPPAIPPSVAAKPVAVPAMTQPSAAVTAATKPNPPPAVKEPPKPAPKPRPDNDFVTTTGAVYKQAQVERVEADGVIVSYVPAGGGLAITKVYFEDLSESVRQLYQKKKK